MKVYGHRGASLYAPQNTLAAFELAFRMGAYGVENDVHMTSDGEIVVVHNPDTEEMCGKKLVVAESTLAELKELDIIDKTGKYPGQKIPTLAETFDSKAVLVLVVGFLDIVFPFFLFDADSDFDFGFVEFLY